MNNTLQRCLLLPWPGSVTIPDCICLTQSSHFCYPLLHGCWGHLQLFSGFQMWCRFKVVVWTKRPALVTPTPYFKKTPITSAGMSRQAMSAAAAVGCLNSCYTRFHTISLSLCVSWLLRPSSLLISFFLCTSFVVCFSGLTVIWKVLVCVVNHFKLPPKQLACLILNTTLFLLLISDWISVGFLFFVFFQWTFALFFKSSVLVS